MMDSRHRIANAGSGSGVDGCAENDSQIARSNISFMCNEKNAC